MAQMQPVRGTHDLLPEDCRKYRHIADTARKISSLYGFGEIETPIFESSAVFSRTLGDTSDIVTKEMYTFQDRGGDDITLRPEGTAGIARAFISEGLNHQTPLKLFYYGPMFRYERPQKGRYRQFYQHGVELLGVESPLADIEVIALAHQILQTLKVGDQARLLLNTIGDSESRENYRTRLVSYLEKYRADLSTESQARLERNPLRILDSKDENDRKIVAGAPLFSDSLNEPSKLFFDQVREGLTRLGIDFQVDPKLVRGLDYYCHTVFEFVTDALGSQGAIVAGGRYDGLIKSMGGPHTPGVGWASGTDRVSMLLPELPAPARPIAVIPQSTEMEAPALQITQSLRLDGFATDLGYSGNMGKRFKRADKIGARAAIVVASDEYSRQAVQVKDLDSGEQTEVRIADLSSHLRKTTEV